MTRMAQVLLTVSVSILTLSGIAIGANDKLVDLPVIDPAKTPSPSATPTPPPPPSPPIVIDLPDFDPPADLPDDEPAPTFFGEEIALENDSIIYVLDRSGSMSKWSGTSNKSRITVAREETIRSINNLSPSLNFNLIFFDCGLTTWKPAPVPATESNKGAAESWVIAMKMGGMTGTAPAVVAALKQDPGAVVLLTDGGPNCPSGGYTDQDGWDKHHRKMIRGANNKGRPIHVFGIGVYDSFRAFCRGVASDSGGNYYER